MALVLSFRPLSRRAEAEAAVVRPVRYPVVVAGEAVGWVAGVVR